VPHPGAQLRPVECNGRRITCFATNTSGGQLPDLKRRHRRRARAEDRIRWVKDIGLANLRLHDAASNAVWLAIVLLACDLLTWTQTLSLSGPLRVAEPKTLRLRLVAIAGRLTGSGRRTQLRLDRPWPWAATVAVAVAALRAFPTPADNTALAPTARGPGTTPRRDRRQ
jgi:hypothetical protein